MNSVSTFVAGFANKEYFSQSRGRTRAAIEHVAARMTTVQRENFPEDLAIFAPEEGGQCGMICITRPCQLLYFDPAIEQKTQAEVNKVVAGEFARLVTHDPQEPATEFEAQMIADLVEQWTAPERVANAA